MLVVIASATDEGARTFVERCKSYGALLLTVKDLSSAGWRYYPDDPDRSQAVIGGQMVANRAISGVLTRLAAVTEQELSHIVPEDRAYAAAEMTAFLVSWLSTLKCPVLNRPSPPCLGGPDWRRERWTLRASGLGMPVAPHFRSTPPFGEGVSAPANETPSLDTGTYSGAARLTVIGERCVGTTNENLAHQARQLAASVGVDLLAVTFSGQEYGAQFVDAHPWVNIWDDAVVEALLDYFIPHVRPSSQQGVGA